MAILNMNDQDTHVEGCQEDFEEMTRASTPDSDFASPVRDPSKERPPRDKGPKLLCAIAAKFKPYDIRPVPGKDLGLVARGPIQRGQPIFAETPLIYYSHHHGDEDILQQFHRLNAGEKRQLLALHNIRRNERGPVLGVIWTNAVPLRNTRDAALFAVASRINHSCSPNTHAVWDATSGCLTAYAVRDIKDGEEITSTYLKSPSCYAERQEYLAERLGFNCECDLCSLDLVARWKSDERITLIRTIKKEIKANLAAESKESRNIALVRDLLGLYERESIVDWRPAEAYRLATGFAILQGDFERAAIFAQRCADLYEKVEGTGNPLVSRMRKVSLKGKSHCPCSGESCQRFCPKEGSQEYEDWLFEDEKGETCK